MNDQAQSTSVLARLVERARDLYSLPAVAMQVVELTNSPKIDVAALKDCVEKDPALTAKILHVVNSSLFGLSQEVCDLGQALSMLGSKPLKLLVLGFSLPPALFDDVDAETLADYWRHTLFKAVAAREISSRMWGRPGDEAFIAGLLQDIGSLALVKELGQEYIAFLRQARHSGAELSALEMQTMGFDHTILSARLLDHWRLPVVLVRAVAMPLDSQRLCQLPPDERPLPQILHLSELVAILLTRHDPAALQGLLKAGQQYREITVEQWKELMEALEEKVLSLADVLSIELASQATCAEILAAAHAQLATVTDDAAKAMAQPAEAPALQKALQAEPSDGRTKVRQDQSSTEPDLPRDDDPGLLGRLTHSIKSCRQRRCALSLAVVQIDELDALIMQAGQEATGRLVKRVEELVAEMGSPEQAAPVSDGCFACVVEGEDRDEAVERARELLDSLGQWGQRHRSGGAALSISVGVAALSTPPKNYPAQELLDAARRCVYAASIAGGGVRSIQIL